VRAKCTFQSGSASGMLRSSKVGDRVSGACLNGTRCIPTLVPDVDSKVPLWCVWFRADQDESALWTSCKPVSLRLQMTTVVDQLSVGLVQGWTNSLAIVENGQPLATPALAIKSCRAVRIFLDNTEPNPADFFRLVHLRSPELRFQNYASRLCPALWKPLGSLRET